MHSFAVRVVVFCSCVLSCLCFTLPLAGQGTFTVTATPSALSIPQGNQETSTIATTISGGFNNGVSLSASGAPPGVAVSFNPSTIGAPGAGISTMTVSVIRLAQAGNYTITVNASGGGIKQTATVTLTVTAQGLPYFTLSASPSLLNIVQGTQGNSVLTTTVHNGFDHNITLSASGMPSGITVSFVPGIILSPGSGNSKMTISVSSSTPSGTYPITVTASGGGLFQNTAVTVMVASFTISASPASLSIAQGNQGTSQITTAISGGFNYSISLSASSMPTGTTVAFNPQTIPAPGAGNSIMTITVGNSTPVGTYPLTVTGSGGGLLQTVTVTLTVTGSGGGFTLAATPTSLTLQQNGQGYVAVTTRTNGFNNSITLAASGAPFGVTISFNPATIPAPGVGNSTMSIVVFGTTRAGNYPITVTATGGGNKQTVTVTLTVTVAGQPNFSLSAAPASLIVVQGNQGSSSINSTLSGTFNGAINLSASGTPSGVTASFAPATLAAPGSGNSVMTLAANKSVPVGSYPVTVTGNGGGIQQMAVVTLTVAPTGALVLPTSYFMQPYSYTLQVSFGKPPYTYQLVGGSLPAGLTLSQSGTISGSATATGVFPFSVLVTDSSQPPKQETFNYTLNAIIGLDGYGGLTAAPVPNCTQTGYFQLAKVNGRWVLADPDCNAFYRRSVYDADVLFILQQILQQRYDGSIHLWADHSLERMTGWGFNASDIYASLYMLPVPAGGEPPADIQVPFVLYYPALKDVEYAWQTLGLPEPVKDICGGFDSNGYNYYCLNLVDVFDPKWQQGNNGELTFQESLYQNGSSSFNTIPWITSISLGDSDFVFALKGNGGNPYNVGAYPHAGMMAATVNFDYSGQGYQDTELHSKYAWVSYLQNEYGTIDALNQSWNTGGFYTSFGDDGGFGTGTGVLDEDGRHTAWFGTDLANRYFTLVGVNSNLVGDLNAFLYQFTVQTYGVQASTIKTYDHNHLLECGNFGGIGEGGMRPQVMQGLHDSGCDVIVGNWNSTWPAVALSGNQAEYDATGIPVILWYGISSQADSDVSQYPTRGASFADYPSQFARGQQYGNDQQTIFNAQGSNGDYYIMGTAFWGLTDNSSEETNWGFITFMDNAYDGRCAVVAQGTDQYGYPCGGEATNYGDFLDGVTQTNSTILQRVIKSLQQ
jgi:uncharacterized membrane protein